MCLTIQYSVYNGRNINDSSSECSRFIKKAKEQTLCKKTHIKKVLEVQEILVILTLLAVLITKERAAKSN